MQLEELLRAVVVLKKRKTISPRRTFALLATTYVATQSPYLAMVNAMDSAKQRAVTILDGTATAKAIRLELKNEVMELARMHGVTPGLGVVLVGDRTDSASYVRMKTKVAAEVGILLKETRLPASTTTESVVEAVELLNADTEIHGILVQLPLPAAVDESKVLTSILVRKDVDGFSAENIGKLMLKGEAPLARPCTPAGCLELLRRYEVPLAGQRAVVLGRSNIVGAPLAAMLTACDATVTLCHSRTKDLSKICQEADILVAAMGKAHFVQKDWLKDGVAIVDVGINAVDDPTAKRGYRLVGDVHPDAMDLASFMTPVPGGVGPMTIAMLMDNVLNLTRHSLNLPPRGPLGGQAS